MAHPRLRKDGHNRGCVGKTPSHLRSRGSFFRVFTRKNTHFSVVFLSKQDTRVPPSGLNPFLLALFVDLRYSISIFVCRLVVTENISGEGEAIARPPLSPGYVFAFVLFAFGYRAYIVARFYSTVHYLKVGY